MPIYPCKCSVCGHYEEPFRSVSEYNAHPDHCGKQMVGVLCRPFVVEDMKPYKSPIDGQWVKSRKDHRMHMKKHGVIEVGNEKLTKPYRKEYKPDSNLKRDIYEAMR